MVNVFNLMPGDRVRIVTKWPPAGQQNQSGGMDHWLGKVMTVRCVYDRYAKMREDIGEWHGDGWSWFDNMIEKIEDDEYQAAVEEDIKTLFGI